MGGSVEIVTFVFYAVAVVAGNNDGDEWHFGLCIVDEDVREL